MELAWLRGRKRRRTLGEFRGQNRLPERRAPGQRARLSFHKLCPRIKVKNPDVPSGDKAERGMKPTP
jgi:hypothetical protein